MVTKFCQPRKSGYNVKMVRSKFFVVLAAIIFVGIAAVFYSKKNSVYFFGGFSKRTADIGEIKNTVPFSQPGEQDKGIPRLSVLAENLQIPWSLVFLPTGEILFTERPGRVRMIGQNGNLLASPVATIGEVKHIGEGGLLGIEIHPNFENNGFVYLYYTYGENNGSTLNRVVRFRFDGRNLTDARVIVEAIPGASNHNGGRIKFGSSFASEGASAGRPDYYLYITTGDAQNPSLAQDKNSLAGKILRVTDDGKPAPGNPFGNEVYSYGHRNPQGITWDEGSRLWSSEHGSNATDELNLVEVGKNYGWPIARGDETREGLTPPVLHSGSDTWAPAGAAYLAGSIYFGGLRGQALYQAVLSGNTATLRTNLKGELGRIRDVVVGPDGMLYVTTSNRDGRGNPRSDDDKIIRVNPTGL